MMVIDLIDSSIAKWKNEVIDSLFIVHEAELIKSISLSASLPTTNLSGLKLTMENSLLEVHIS